MKAFHFLILCLMILTALRCQGKSPEWAKALKEAMDALRKLAHWWIDRQDPDKGIGFGADDVESVLLSVPILVLGQGDRKSRRALEILADQMWERYGVYNGQEIGYPWQPSSDVEHAAEPISNSQTKMLLIDYGNPKYVERCMISIRNMYHWTDVNDAGHRHFKSFMFGGLGEDESKYYDCDVPLNARAVIPGFFLAWFNRDPEVMRLMTEWADAWIDHSRSSELGKPVGLLPSEIRFRDDKVGGYSGAWDKCAGYRQFEGLTYNIYYFMLAMYMLTGDDKYLEPYRAWIINEYGGSSYPDEDAAMYRMFTGRTDLDQYFRNSTHWLWRWILRKDQKVLVEQCRRIKEEILSSFEMRTSGIDFRDANANYITCVDEMVLNVMFTGGLLHHVGAYPFVPVTWEDNIDDSFAANVIDHTRERLAILVHNCGRRALRPGLRIWELDAGSYIFMSTAGKDSRILPESWRQYKEVDIARGTVIQFELPPLTTLKLELEIRKRKTELCAHVPILAFSKEDILCSKEAPKPGDDVSLSLTLHNIGTQALKSVELIVEEIGSGELIHKASIHEIPAPKKLSPSRLTLTFPWSISDEAKGIRIYSTNTPVCNGCVEVMLDGLRVKPWRPNVETELGDIPPEHPKEISSSLTWVPPNIDGEGTDLCWSLAVPVELTERMYSEDETVTNRTVVRTCWDRSNIYFLFECFDPLPSTLKAESVERDAPLWNEESVELFIDPRHDHRFFYQFAVNPIGTVYDAEMVAPMWDGGWKAATNINPDGWTAEIALPLSSLGIEPKIGSVIGVNFVRTSVLAPERKNKETCIWQRIPRWTQRPAFFGHLVFNAIDGQDESTEDNIPGS